MINGVIKYSAASLSDEARAKLVGQNPDRNTRPAEASVSLTPLFAPVLADHAPRITLSPEAQKQAEERLQVIRPLLEYCSDPETKARCRQLQLRDGNPVTTSNRMADYLSELYTGQGRRISARNIWRWKKEYTEGGLVALARDIRKDKGQSRFFSRYPEAATLVASVWLKPYQTAAQAHTALLRAGSQLGIPAMELPTYQTVRSYLETIPRPITVMARMGERAYHERMTPYLQRGYEDVAANEIWVADHMIHDVEVRNDCFAGVPEGAPMRLRFSAFIDMRSRRFVGYCWAPEGNSRVITTALRRGIERYGPPEYVLCDNGSDYKKVAKGARPVAEDLRKADYESLEKSGVLQRLGIGVQFCRPYHPQSKLIERAFRTVHQGFDALFPHYTTGNAYTKPDQTVIAMNSHRKLLKMGLAASSPLIPASHFIRMATEWIEGTYNATHRHSGKGMAGMTPEQVFDAGYPLAQRRTASPDILAHLLWESEKRKVRETAITLNKRRYIPADDRSSAALHLQNEREVRICYDPHDMDRAIVTDLDGHILAQVQSEVLAPHSAAAKPMIAASAQEGKRLRKATVSTVKQIHHAVAMLPYESDLQILHQQSLQSQPLAMTGSDSIVHRRPTPPAGPAGGKQIHVNDIAAAFLEND